VIEFIDVTTGFGDRPVLRSLDLLVEEGETYVLLGPSGAGKSVLLKHIVGLIRPGSGTVRVAGVEIATQGRRALAELRRSIGYVFQNGALINWLTVADNVALPMREHTKASPAEIDAKVERLLSLVHLEGDGTKFPDEISGGMRKRVGIARALALDPRIVLFDEPTAGLDPIRSRSLAEVIAEMRKSRRLTSLVVTHNLDLAFAIADRIGFLEKGRISVQGSPEEVSRSDDPFVRAFLASESMDLDAGADDVGTGPRVGVDYAGAWAAEPLRFWIDGHDAVSRRP